MKFGHGWHSPMSAEKTVVEHGTKARLPETSSSKAPTLTKNLDGLANRIYEAYTRKSPSRVVESIAGKGPASRSRTDSNKRVYSPCDREDGSVIIEGGQKLRRTHSRSLGASQFSTKA
ncbi:hypothetical protein PAXRUDRAFT_726267 [Paxillus rubicundulus Ve08.2h10]|uniref:Unplaced genomic scaffold scaffold_847, whole genome shotgun sequence n=1 Tax=Paxillus rubicundulus Ve08.2h10 TaxID=930991 RepID=A0A0D0DD15_9AGAM|nr:hypothetical protein PAXRUDRAFT_726267 [Paxillus rubicundulus Ve08.2h10]